MAMSRQIELDLTFSKSINSTFMEYENKGGSHGGLQYKYEYKELELARYSLELMRPLNLFIRTTFEFKGICYLSDKGKTKIWFYGICTNLLIWHFNIINFCSPIR